MKWPVLLCAEPRSPVPIYSGTAFISDKDFPSQDSRVWTGAPRGWMVTSLSQGNSPLGPGSTDPGLNILFCPQKMASHVKFPLYITNIFAINVRNLPGRWFVSPGLCPFLYPFFSVQKSLSLQNLSGLNLVEWLTERKHGKRMNSKNLIINENTSGQRSNNY